jgi:hypothetical protein
MSVRARMAAAALLLVLPPGCTPWPGRAEGGLAERYDIENPISAELRARYEAVVARGAAQRTPARLLEVKGVIIRAHREWAGGLHIDAERTSQRLSLIHI